MTFLLLICYCVILIIFLFTLDDLFLDSLALGLGAKPEELTAAELSSLRKLPQKRVAILIANWKEDEIIEYMVRGNLDGIDYDNYSIFLGVYPNDKLTWEAARRAEAAADNVHVIVNNVAGPTSKGQLLNQMAEQILASEKTTGLKHELFALHDSEDLIHPLSLLLLNGESDSADFLQLPVFSIQPLPAQLVAGVYADEFAESHAKDMLVRSKLRAAVPSAGVGTTISRKLLLALQRVQNGKLLNEDCLTEDYQLGILASQLGYRTKFLCRFTGRSNFIATREYFPETFSSSVRQKTRWTTGIAFQSKQRFGWHGSLKERYFFWRDRRGPWNAVLLLGAIFTLIVFTGHLVATHELPEVAPWVRWIALINLFQMGLRLAQRIRFTARVYGLIYALFVPLRWPVGNLINMAAAWLAFREHRRSQLTGVRIAWAKTQHKLPTNFGRPVNQVPEELRA